jgi:hypothetical protein
VDKTCKVCSQKASGLHFGVNTCEGCKVIIYYKLIKYVKLILKFSKAFFLRSLKNEKYKQYKCKSNYDCQINGCKFCRFDKCAQVGMSHDGI